MATLADIRLKVRKVTARPSQNQIADADIDFYINTYYQYDFPQQMKTFNLKTLYSFDTQPNQDQYTFVPNSFYSVEGPMYASGFQIGFYENRELFYNAYPKQFYPTTIGTGDGVTTSFTSVLPTVPFLENEVLVSAPAITGVSLVANDDGAGLLLGNVLVGSVVNYITGAITVNFTAPIVAGQPVTVKTVPYVASRPLSILYYQNTFVLRPVPDDVYKIEMQAYMKPTAFLTAAPTSEPVLQEYWQALAYGAAAKIFADNMDMENLQKVTPLLNEQLMFIQRRTLMQIKTQRPPTIYSENTFWGGQRSSAN